MNRDFTEYPRFIRAIIRVKSFVFFYVSRMIGGCVNDKLGVTQYSSSNYSKYICFVRRATLSDRCFKNFKRNFHYREVLEHVPFSQAAEYFELLPDSVSGLSKSKLIDRAMINDVVGNPIQYRLGDKYISGSSMRYLYLSHQILQNIAKDNHIDVAEIGVGYGGQALVLSQFVNINSYNLIDLPSVCELVNKYLNSFYLDFVFNASDINNVEKKSWDLCISNYAFSELPRRLQKIYLDRVILNSKQGYMIMNTGNDVSAATATDKYRATELLEIIPDSRIIDEIPLTSNNNYVIVWG